MQGWRGSRIAGLVAIVGLAALTMAVFVASFRAASYRAAGEKKQAGYQEREHEAAAAKSPPPRTIASPAEVVSFPERTWHDAAGLYEIEASFVALSGSNVTLKRKDGRAIRLPWNLLSQQDQAWVTQHSQPKTANTFE